MKSEISIKEPFGIDIKRGTAGLTRERDIERQQLHPTERKADDLRRTPLLLAPLPPSLIKPPHPLPGDKMTLLGAHKT